MGRCSEENFPHDFSFYVGKTVITATMSVSEAFVIEPQQVQHRGVKVMDVNFAIDRCHTEFVGGPVNVAGPDTAASQPHAIPLVVVASTV